QVAGGGRVGGDDELPPRAPGPATEPAGPEAAQVQDAARRAVGQFHPERAGAGRDLHRQVVPGGGEAVGQGPPASVRGAGHVSIRPDRRRCASPRPTPPASRPPGPRPPGPPAARPSPGPLTARPYPPAGSAWRAGHTAVPPGG